jgi:hypothetical protein
VAGPTRSAQETKAFQSAKKSNFLPMTDNGEGYKQQQQQQQFQRKDEPAGFQK